METNHATEIKVTLLRLGVTQAQIARELAVSRVSVNQVVNGSRKSRRISDYIETLTKKKPGRKAA